MYELLELSLLTRANGDNHARWSTRLGFALPEMVYGNNRLALLHEPSGTLLSFSGWEALSQVIRTNKEDQIKVPFADEWAANARFVSCSTMRILLTFYHHMTTSCDCLEMEQTGCRKAYQERP